MAKMVPTRFNPKITSFGEQQLFRALAALPDTYTVFHSVALNGHVGKLFAEIDFLLLCPQGVLCLEVKGGRIKCHERQWYSYGRGSEYRPIQNPFTQAQSAAMALYNDVKKYFRTNRTITNACFASGVAFPDISFTEQGPEIRREIVYDKNSGDLQAYIDKVFVYWKSEFRRRHKYELTGLSDVARQQLEKYLYSNFDIVYTVGTMVNQVEQETIRLTQEQKRVLNYVAQNDRILMIGGAGTGKTILCLEQAWRLAKAGARVLFLCFNHNLAFHLRHRVALQSPAADDSLIQVHAVYKYLAQILQENAALPPQPAPGDREAVNRYWREEIPGAFLRLAQDKRHQQFDVLILDEGQDLLNPALLDCLDKLLEGGLDIGRWVAAMDPNQNLYQTQLGAGLARLKKAGPALLTLEDNYRNTKEIIDYTVNRTGISPRLRALIQGIAIREDYYTTLEEQRIKLIKVLEQLQKNEVAPAGICIVSLTSFEKSVLQGNPSIGKFIVQDLADLSPDQWDPEKVKFSSVYRFKGLESPVVILSDVVKTDGEYAARCYTAMTRAKALLWVLRQHPADELAP